MHVLAPGATGRYRHLAGLASVDSPGWEHSLRLRFVPQHGRYADITSIVNAARLLRPDELYVAFADNLYPHDNPTVALSRAPAGVSVLVRAYHPSEAGRRGVVVALDRDGQKLMVDLVEKPDPVVTAALELRHGTENLWLLEGRARVSADFLAALPGRHPARGAEPKLSMALRAFSRNQPVRLVPTASAVIDLGVPNHQTIATQHAGTAWW